MFAALSVSAGAVFGLQGPTTARTQNSNTLSWPKLTLIKGKYKNEIKKNTQTFVQIIFKREINSDDYTNKSKK